MVTGQTDLNVPETSLNLNCVQTALIGRLLISNRLALALPTAADSTTAAANPVSSSLLLVRICVLLCRARLPRAGSPQTVRRKPAGGKSAVRSERFVGSA
jgi:hypothetical protein